MMRRGGAHAGVCTVLAAVLSASAIVACNGQSAKNAGDSFPLVEVPADSGHTMALFLTGDGGWASGDRALAETLARGGVSVVGVDSRAYLRSARRTPESAAADAARIVDEYAARWHRDRLILVGYSRGADMAPFIVTRLPDELRNRLSLVAMIGLAERASFEFHWADMVLNTKRSTDYPVAPEVMKVQGVRMLCLYGAREKDSLCPTFPPSVLHAEQHDGKHALSGSDGVAVAQRILREIDGGEAEHRTAPPQS